MEAAVPASAKAPSTLEAAVSAEAALVWWLDTLVGQGDGVGLSGAGRFVGEDIPSTFRGGGTYTLTVDSNSAVLVLKDYFDNFNSKTVLSTHRPLPLPFIPSWGTMRLLIQALITQLRSMFYTFVIIMKLVFLTSPKPPFLSTIMDLPLAP